MSGIDKVHREKLKEAELLKEISEAIVPEVKLNFWQKIKRFFSKLFS